MEVLPIWNMVTLAIIQIIFCIFHIFKGNSFMQRGFCRCTMCLNIRMDKFNNLLCTYTVKAKVSPFTVLIFFIYTMSQDI